MDTTHAILTFMRLDGSIIRTVTSSSSDSTFDPGISNIDNYIGFSTALLSSDQLTTSAGVSDTKWAILDKSGHSRPVAASLTPFLNMSWQPGTPHIKAGIFLTGADTLFADVSSDRQDTYDRVNLTTGAVTPLLTVHATQPSTPFSYAFIPQGITPSGQEITFLIGNASVNGQTVNGLGVATYSVASGALDIRMQPAAVADAFFPPPGTSAWAPDTYVSADGNLLVYRSTSAASGDQPVTHFVHVRGTSPDVTITEPNGASFGGALTAVLFSPDDSYVALTDLGPSGGESLRVVSTSTGKSIKSLGVADLGAASLAALGWSASGEFVYSTNANPSPDQGTTHALDVGTGQVRDYPASVGQCVAVLY